MIYFSKVKRTKGVESWSVWKHDEQVGMMLVKDNLSLAECNEWLKHLHEAYQLGMKSITTPLKEALAPIFRPMFDNLQDQITFHRHPTGDE